MILNLPLAEENEVEIDYTEIDSIKFSRKMSGLERAKHIAQVFADYFCVSLYDGHKSTAYKEFGVKTDSFFIGFRGYTNIVVCIVNDYGMPRFGPNNRDSARRSGCLFEEVKNVFPFRAVLQKVRDKVNILAEQKRQVELMEQEKDFKYLQLEGSFLSSIDGIDISNMVRTNYGTQLGIEFTFQEPSNGLSYNYSDRYYRSCVYIDENSPGKYMIKPFGTSHQIQNCSIEKVNNFLNAIKDLYKEE